VRRVSLVVGPALIVLGFFWAGRESSHGLAAFWEHWWCPLPLAMIALGSASLLAALPHTHRSS
jgi:hypothetical protein